MATANRAVGLDFLQPTADALEFFKNLLGSSPPEKRLRITIPLSDERRASQIASASTVYTLFHN